MEQFVDSENKAFLKKISELNTFSVLLFVLIGMQFVKGKIQKMKFLTHLITIHSYTCAWYF